MVSFNRSPWDRDVDPKLAWALEHREQFPVDLNCASREVLERVPGLGDRAIQRLLQLRRQKPIGVAEVRKLRVNWHQVRYFVATSDHCPRRIVPEQRPAAVAVPVTPLAQLSLFDALS
jgi:predicted DNA-binding helix-hairpin-helix protein